ncbi:hypothetical protein BT67DRAFT_131202 [Trichocladium antarcticum]|uniref:Uncharacterized protein n=1 Tax=Trichocladium antarcticum TaxID=1450529 RepID=A0AAN6URW8_9PEZI|nr:hypothetical protein BT67DRAFT_131202 [Trichocladium antarcticum]
MDGPARPSVVNRARINQQPLQRGPAMPTTPTPGCLQSCQPTPTPLPPPPTDHLFRHGGTRQEEVSMQLRQPQAISRCNIPPRRRDDQEPTNTAADRAPSSPPPSKQPDHGPLRTGGGGGKNDPPSPSPAGEPGCCFPQTRQPPGPACATAHRDTHRICMFGRRAPAVLFPA